MAAPRRPAALHGRVVRKRDVVGSGLLTASELCSSAWRRRYRGVHADATLPDSFGVRLGGARLLVPPTAVLSGRTAAYLHVTAADPGEPAALVRRVTSLLARTTSGE